MGEIPSSLVLSPSSDVGVHEGSIPLFLTAPFN